MRWGKALTNLIIIFILLNIVLAFWNYDKSINTYRLTPQRMNNVTSLLEKEDITLKVPLPESFRPQSPIWIVPVEITSEKRDKLVKSILGAGDSKVSITKEKSTRPYENPSRIYTKDTEILRFQNNNNIIYENTAALVDKSEEAKAPKREQALSFAKEFAQKVELGDNFKEIEVRYVEAGTWGRVIYYETYKGSPIFNSYIHMKVSEKGVFKAYIHALDVEETKTSKKSIYPIDRVLIALQDILKERAPVTISSIELGYAMKNTQGIHILKEEAIPMYKMMLDGLDVPLFVNAYTNTLEPGPWEK